MNPKPPITRTGKSGWLGRNATRLKGLAVAGAVSLGFAGAAFAAAAPASADPSVQFVEVGSDTTQAVMDFFAGQVSNGILGSYDAVNPITQTANETITPAIAQGGGAQLQCTFNRPNGSGAGFRAMDYSYTQVNTFNLAVAAQPQAGCITLARSSATPGHIATSGPGAQSNTGNYVYIPFAIDAVTYATGYTPLNYTATSASPAVFTAPGSGGVLLAGQLVQLAGTVPTGFSTGTSYCVFNPNASANTFELTAAPTAPNPCASPIASTSTGSGTINLVETTLCNGPTTPSGFTCSSTTGPGNVTFVDGGPAGPGVVTGTTISQTANLTVAQLQTLYGHCQPVTVGTTTLTPGTQFNFSVTSPATPAVFTTTTSSNFTANQVVTLGFTGTTSTLPTPFTTGTSYYVIAPTATTFELATSPGGAPIASTGASAGSGIVSALGTVDLYAPQSGSGTLLFWETAMGVSAPQSCWHQNVVAGPATGVSTQEHDGTAVASDPIGIEPVSIGKWITFSKGLVFDVRHGDALQSITAGGIVVPPIDSSGNLNISGCAAVGSNQATCFPETRELYNVMDFYEVVNTAPISGTINNPAFNPVLAGLFAGSTSSLCGSVFTIQNIGFGTIPTTNNPFADSCGATTAANRVQMNTNSTQG